MAEEEGFKNSINLETDCNNDHNVSPKQEAVQNDLTPCPESINKEVNDNISANLTKKQGNQSADKDNPIVSHDNVSLQSKDNKDYLNNGINKTKKCDRRVTFPNDVICGYHEPRIPWNDVSECSPEELVSAYKRSCIKHDVKPLPKLLQQLHAITNFHERNETLTVRGENLNIRHSETLEEILRRVQFRTIDLEASHLDEESAIAIFDMVEFYQSAIRVNISYNKIGLRGWQACSRMLKKTPCVQHLDARCCSLTEQVLPIFGRALRLGSMLKILHLENSIMSGRSLMILVAAIKMNEVIEELFLADNKLMPSDGIQLGNLLKFNHKIRLLDVRNNHLGDVGTTHISDGLYEQNMGNGLETLVLWNNQITYQSMVSLGRALKSTRNLETINLGHNNITNEGVHRLKDGLMHNRSLLRIGLQASKIYCEGAVALAECIAESMFLVRLDLRENDIKTGGLMALALALKVNNSVNRIDIDQNPKKESGVKDFADQQRRLLQDISNYSQRNRDLTLRKEEEERQHKLEQEMLAALKECEEATEERTLNSEAIKIDTKKTTSELQPMSKEIKSSTTKLESVSSEKPQESSNTDSDADVFKDVSSEKSDTDAQSHHLRIQLHLPIPSRSQSLDSPVETPEIVYPPLKIPNTVNEHEILTEVKQESPLPPELPPSPMVSHEGKSIRASVESSGLSFALVESNLISTDSDTLTGSDDSNSQLSTNTNNNSVSKTGSNSCKLNSPLNHSPKRSPMSKKFTISRVAEPVSVHHGTHSNTQYPQEMLGDPLGAISGSEISTLKPKTVGKPNPSMTNVNNIVSNSKKEEISSDALEVLQDLKIVSTDNIENAKNDKVGIKDSNVDHHINNSNREINSSENNTTMSLDSSLSTPCSDRSSLTEPTYSDDSFVILCTNESNLAKTNDPELSLTNSSNSDNILNKASDNYSAIENKKSCDNSDEHQKQMVASSNIMCSGEHSRSTGVVLSAETGASASGSNSCNETTNIVSLNGVTIDVNDLLEGVDVPEMQACDGDSASSSLDLLSSADDFEKELDSMLANVQSGIQSESSS